MMDPDRTVRIVIDAAEMSDKLASEYWNVGERTIQRYRQMVATDPALANLYEEKRKTASAVHEEAWKSTRLRFLRKSVAKLEQLVDQADVKQIRVVAGAIKIVGDLHNENTALGALDERAEDPREGQGTPSPAPDDAGSESAAPVH